MLNTMRHAAQGLIAKLILFFLIGLFVLWGIGDIFRSGGGSANVATVGRTPISMQEFARSLHHRQEELRQMLGAAYTPDMVRKLGIPAQVLSGLINSLLIAREDEALGIMISDDEIVEALRNNPEFQNAQKQFDKTLYLSALKSRGIPERRYVADMRRELAAELLLSTLARAVVVPEPLVQELYKARGEQRVAELMVIAPGAARQEFAPSEKDLKAYYDAHAASFLAPETRTVRYVEIRAADVQAHVQVPEEDIKRAYEERSGDWRIPQRRVIEQMVFDNEADAVKAADALAGGAHFDDVARTMPIANKGKLALGALTHDQLPAAADAVFALKEGASSAPVKTAFGWHIFHVSAIMPESAMPLAQARADILRDLSAKASQETMYKLVGELEDALAGGLALENAAQKIGQSVHTAGPMTRDGLSPQGKKIALPATEALLNVAFATPQGEHSQATPAADGSYFLVQTDAVTPEHARPFAEVRNQVESAWKEEKSNAQLEAAAEAIARDVQAGKKPADALAAQHVNAEPVTSGKLRRDSESVPEVSPLAGKALPRAMVLELFRLKNHAATHAYPWAGGGMAIATLSQIIPAHLPADAPALDAIRKELKETMSNEELHQYLTYLQGKYRVTINESALGAAGQDGGE